MLRVVIQTLSAYIAVMVALRLFGRRQMTQLSAVDLIVIVLLGSAVETALVAGDRSLTAGLVSAGTLLLANKLLTVTLGRSKRLHRLMVGEPVLLINDGAIINERLEKMGLTKDDLLQALRERGVDDPADVRFAVAEIDGSINVVRKDR